MLVILLHAGRVLALNSALDINQYAHTAWTLRDGAFKGYPRSLAQTTDGYLWLGTEFGILRFDGVRFVRWEPPAGVQLPSNVINRLLAGRDASLWIGTQAGLARWKDMTLRGFSELAGQTIMAILEDRDGVVWVGTNALGKGLGKLCAIRNDEVKCHDGTLGAYVISLYEDTDGTLWVGAASGLWRWKPGVPKVYSARALSDSTSLAEIHSFVQADSAGLLVALDREVKQLIDDTLHPYSLSVGRTPLKPTSLLREASGGLWIGTQDQGLLHVHDGRTDQFTQADGLSGDFVSDLLQDREGTVWVATLGGLDSFRDFAVATISVRQGLSNATVFSVLASSNGDMWLGTVDGLNRWNRTSTSVERKTTGQSNSEASCLFEDDRGGLWVSSRRGLAYLKDGRSTQATEAPSGYVNAIVQDNEKKIWVSAQKSGLARVSEGREVTVFPWSSFGGKRVQALASDSVSGGLWLGFFEGGIAHFRDDGVRASYTSADGLAPGEVTSLYFDRENTLWIATRGGLSRLKNGSVVTLSKRNGLPCDAIHWVIEDDLESFWLLSACGLVRIARQEIDTWTRKPDGTVPLTVYDELDGILSYAETDSFHPKVTKTSDGKIWFATYDGAKIIDPKHLPFNKVAPRVLIEQITADRQIYDVTSPLHLPAVVRDLRIDYTATSLVVPSKVRFKYKLEGRDTDWVDAGNRRQAFYTDLAPKAYRFHLLASNNDGAWNEEGAFLDFSIPPAFYQTQAFRLAVASLVALLLWMAYWLRLRQMTAKLNVRFEERLAERTRIAQELHDTLLQGFASMSMQLHVVAEGLTGHSLRPRLDQILRRLSQVMEEGRQTVQALRSPFLVDTLEDALTRDAQDFRGEHDVDVRVVVAGKRQPLHPLIRDEAYRIGREALANAFRHARADRIDVELEYSPAHLRLNVQDNGCGIEQSVLTSGRPGHWGLPGMRERAERLGATLKVRTRVNSGTEVELLVPAPLAFQQASAARVHT